MGAWGPIARIFQTVNQLFRKQLMWSVSRRVKKPKPHGCISKFFESAYILEHVYIV